MTAQVSKIVENDFRKRLERVLYLIESYGIRYSEIGVFGSYARNDYVAASDIKLCIITDYRPGLKVSGSLREDAEELNVDIVWITPDSFQNSDSRFMTNIRKDYRRVA